MLSRERERTEEANRRAGEERKRADQRIEALMNELRDEPRQSDERLDEERRQAAEERRILMATITELTGAITELRRENGRDNGSDNE